MLKNHARLFTTISFSLFTLLLCATMPQYLSAQSADDSDDTNTSSDMSDSDAQNQGYSFKKENPEPAVPDGDNTEDGADVSAVAAPPIAQVIKTNWSNWSGGKQSASWADFVDRMQDPAIKNENAAALATVIRSLRKTKEASFSADEVITNLTPKLTDGYKKAFQALGGANRSLFASGKPDFNKMRQGPATDCYFFSGTGWIAKYRPEVIVKAVKEIPGKGYRVKFPDGQSADVPSPTDTEIAYNDSASTLSDGLWMSVLAKAEGIIEARKSETRAEIADPALRVDIGGGPLPIVKRWTGKTPVSFHLGEKAKKEKVRRELMRMQDKNRMAEVFARIPKGKIAGNHCYAVLGFDAATDTVTVWNPWGNDFTPKGPDGPDFGYTRRQGTFNISLDEFIRCFFFMSIEP